MNNTATTFTIRSRGARSAASPRRMLRRTRGVTLVELMVASILFTMVATGLLMTLLHAYRLAAETRIRNEARFVLRSMADQFSRTTYSATNPLFRITSLPTGQGLSWRKETNVFSLKPVGANDEDYIDGTVSGLTVPLGVRSGAPVDVSFTCWIRGVNPSTGVATDAIPPGTAGGYLLRGDFTATFKIAGKSLTQTTSILRAVP